LVEFRNTRLICQLDYASDGSSGFGLVYPYTSYMWGSGRVERPSVFDNGRVAIVNVANDVRGKCNDDIPRDFLRWWNEVGARHVGVWIKEEFLA
jgi:hypothetical protein